MKKIDKLICFFLIFASFLFSFSSCNLTDKTDDTPLPPQTNTIEPSNSVDLVKNGKSNFKILKYYGSDKTLQQAAETVQSRIRTATGVTLPIVSSTQEVNEGELVITIGTSSGYGEINDALAQWDVGYYGYFYRNGKLMILGHSDSMTQLALQSFLKAVYASVRKNDRTVDLVLSFGESTVTNFDSWMEQVPLPKEKYRSIYDCGDRTFLLYYQNFPESSLALEKSNLQNAGFVLKQENAFNGNQFFTFVRQDGEVNLIYSKDRVLRLVSERYTEKTVSIPAPEPVVSKVIEPKLALLSLNYTAACTDMTDTSGLSMVLTLEDGRFVIIDGGYKEDAHGLFNYLSDHNVRTDGVIIAAWILTHGHPDHVGCFEQFIQDYASSIQCQYLVSNGLDSAVIPSNEKTNDLATTHIEDYCAYFKGNTKVLKIHAGQKLMMGGMELEMLYNHEVFYPKTVAYLNETSLVMKIKLGGQTLLMTGDNEVKALSDLMSFCGNTLLADFYQINHHGYSDIGTEFFNFVNPKVALWPTGQICAEKRLSSAWRNGQYVTLTNQVEEYCVADGKTEVFTLPHVKGNTIEQYTMCFSKR